MSLRCNLSPSRGSISRCKSTRTSKIQTNKPLPSRPQPSRPQRSRLQPRKPWSLLSFKAPTKRASRRRTRTPGLTASKRATRISKKGTSIARMSSLMISRASCRRKKPRAIPSESAQVALSNQPQRSSPPSPRVKATSPLMKATESLTRARKASKLPHQQRSCRKTKLSHLIPTNLTSSSKTPQALLEGAYSRM